MDTQEEVVEIEAQINNVTFQETANVFNNAHARGSKLYFMFNVIPTVVEDSECLPRHCNNKSEVCHHRSH